MSREDRPEKRLLLALTIDYETWQPLPPGRVIDWQADVFEPARRFAEVATSVSARITFFVEMGEYFFLRQFDPATSARMEDQWRELVRAGHDVQPHLHPNWLPELGARRDGDSWYWDPRFAHLDDYPGDTAELLAKCKAALEGVLLAVDPSYEVSCYRAGAYRAQPFGRLSAALRQAGILCDSSVFRGGISRERGYDYTHAYSDHQPYFCSPDDPQLRARAGEETIVELPIATFGFGQRWSLDGDDQRLFADRLLRSLAGRRPAWPGLAGHPAAWRVLERASTALHRLTRGRTRQLPLHPPFTPPGELTDGHEYFVAIGHTKGEHDFRLLQSELVRINQATRAEWVTLRQLAEMAHADVSASAERRSARDGERAASVSSVSVRSFGPTAQAIADAVEGLVPWAGAEVRVLGDRAREVADKLQSRFPWKRFQAVKPDLQGVACEPLASRPLTCGILAHGGPLPEPALRTWAAGLGPDASVLVPVELATWRLSYPDLASARAALVREWRFRLAAAGLGESQAHVRPNDCDFAGVVVARPTAPVAPRDHLLRVMDWLYETVKPEDGPGAETEPRRVLTNQRALCLGYAATLGTILRRDGYQVEYVTLLARDHERGRSPHQTDVHEVVQVVEAGGGHAILDPTANLLFPWGVLDLLRDPSLANANQDPDERYRSRRYDLYSTSYLYERAYEVCLRQSLDVTTYDSHASWRARLKVLSQLASRTIYRRGKDGEWRRARFRLDPRVPVPFTS